MRRNRVLKVLVGLFSVLFVLSAGTVYLADFYLDSLSPEMGNTEYPEESFNAYSDRTSYEIQEYIRPENIDNDGLMDRLKLSNTMLLDIASTDFTDTGENNSDNQILLGFKTEGCNDIDKGFSQPQFCDELSYYEASMASWLSIMTYSDLNKTFRNSSKMEKYKNTAERIEYYDRKLFDGDSEKRNHIAYQNNSGLYIIGERTDSVKINGTQYSTMINGEWSHIDINLEQGSYNISYSGEEHVFKVFSPTNEVYDDDGKMLIRDRYNSYNYVEVGEETETNRSEIGRRLSHNHSDLETEAKYVNKDVTITKKVRNHEHLDNDSEVAQFSEYTGLNTNSAEKILKAVSLYNKAVGSTPFIQNKLQKIV